MENAYLYAWYVKNIKKIKLIQVFISQFSFWVVFDPLSVQRWGLKERLSRV